jgi:hypothetical protein
MISKAVLESFCWSALNSCVLRPVTPEAFSLSLFKRLLSRPPDPAARENE